MGDLDARSGRGLNVACRTALSPGDMVMTPSPIYRPFVYASDNMNRGRLNTDLKNVEGRLELDYESIEQLMSEEIKMFFFCNPHNPGGTVFNQEEKKEIGRYMREKSNHNMCRRNSFRFDL
ncbi:MAG: hypothetical protein Ct9H300mP20_19000 [Gammaproteobacteria bacterium]|nr:MAG: hypothetical protein Ct9H300mP20_19000 [Gammaproteobacteria bacterium]